MLVKFYKIIIWINEQIFLDNDIREFYNITSKSKYIFSPFYAFLKIMKDRKFSEFEDKNIKVRIIDEKYQYEIIIENGNFLSCKMIKS